MKLTKRTTIVAGLLAVGVVAGAGTAVATQIVDDEAGSTDFTEQQAADATDAALEATGGGTANSVERDSENGATWEVEVTKTDGTTVDVRLDESYEVVVIEGDSEEPDSDGDGDD
ncbi:hypothetical protein NSZ01_20310 [Nocardioides szechwanensis]|uniref:Peptidase propeptide and YPEB domain-containing protein n=1 Tax=Nocardioides szechwanensis TaxID=1005944 RepID=A0A1H0HDI6_9ACTN|nr:PepSY domain-containing protein [Nocardioides szechwanensis]GEP34263.1 hypothetical protein NSZ01_20310 [Nocardioides szechwanensis]SDO17143.1 Peptidase propeptide and YPEB domain-containing protein [Nocardioides szechwanensis]